MKLNIFITITSVILILTGGIFAVYAAIQGDSSRAVLYGIGIAALILLYGFMIIVDKLEQYHEEVSLLRKDLAELNIEISDAFDAVDSNFNTLVHALDDFIIELESTESEIN